jgi:hypothetical protein
MIIVGLPSPEYAIYSPRPPMSMTSALSPDVLLKGEVAGEASCASAATTETPITALSVRNGTTVRQIQSINDSSVH